MVKIAKKSAQDPTDSSLQMKVVTSLPRLGNILSSEGEIQARQNLTQQF